MVNVFVLQLMCLLLQSQVYSVMNTAAYNKFCMEVELLRSKLTLSVSLLDTVNLNLYEEEVDKMQVDQTASADTLMVLLTLLSQAEVLFSLGPKLNTKLSPHTHHHHHHSNF